MGTSTDRPTLGRYRRYRQYHLDPGELADERDPGLLEEVTSDQQGDPGERYRRYLRYRLPHNSGRADEWEFTRGPVGIGRSEAQPSCGNL